MDVSDINKLLDSISEKDIILTTHAKKRCLDRQIKETTIIQNILSQKKLINIEKQTDKKFVLYFDTGKKLNHKYIITIKAKKIVVISVMRIDLKAQRRLNKYGKVPFRL